MKKPILEIIMHPIRMRIIQTMVVGGAMTTQQISEMMPEVPQATMYRHLNTLLRADVILVAEERPVRGTLEKLYSISEAFSEKTNEEMLHASREDQSRYFFSFLINLLGDFERYASGDETDMQKDGVGFRQASVYATDQEFEEFGSAFAEAFSKLLQNKPATGRKLRTFATIVIPEKN